MPHSYRSEYPPGIEIDDGIKAFFEEFYKTSDMPDIHEKYADSFTDNATLIMASKKGVGRDGISSISADSNVGAKISCRNPGDQERPLGYCCVETTYAD